MAKKVIAAGVPGQPGFGTPKSNWPRVPRALRRPRTLPTAIVNNVADGTTQPEFKNLVGANGVSTPGRGGYKGARRILQTPLKPPTSNAGKKSIRAPRSGKITKR